MRLKRSAWKMSRPDSKFSDYILILPDDGIIVIYTAMPDDEEKRVVWGCWFREEDECVVYTALKNATKWRRETYISDELELAWNNGNGTGTHTWTRMPESDIPQKWLDRGLQYLEKLRSHSPPKYNKKQNKSEMATPRKPSD